LEINMTTDSDIQFLHQVLAMVVNGGPMHDFKSPDFRRVMVLIDKYSSSETSVEELDYMLRSLGLTCLSLILARHVQSMQAQREACLAVDAARRSTPLQ